MIDLEVGRRKFTMIVLTLPISNVDSAERRKLNPRVQGREGKVERVGQEELPSSFSSLDQLKN
jgi:hypothetical protein